MSNHWYKKGRGSWIPHRTGEDRRRHQLDEARNIGRTDQEIATSEQLQEIHNAGGQRLLLDANNNVSAHPNQPSSHRKRPLFQISNRDRWDYIPKAKRAREVTDPEPLQGPNKPAQSTLTQHGVTRGRLQPHQNAPTNRLTNVHKSQVRGSPLNFDPLPRTHPTQYNPTREGVDADTPPTPTNNMNNDDNMDGGGGNVEERGPVGQTNQGRPGALVAGGGTKYNYIPRHVSQTEFNLCFRKTVRYDLESQVETLQTFIPGATIWNGTPGTFVGHPWCFLPNQTFELYTTPGQVREMMNLAGWNGSFKPTAASVHIFNTRLAMQLPQETGFLITVDKPYWKVYEDTVYQLFGHGVSGAGAPPPSGNAVSAAQTHTDTQNLTPVGLPQYIHTVAGTVTDDEASRMLNQLQFETTGGVEFYQPGDEIYKQWDIDTPWTSINNQQNTANNTEFNMDSAGSPGQFFGYLTGKQHNFNISRYSTDPADALTTRVPASGKPPPMLLMSVPTINSINVGGGTFLIQSELQMNVTYELNMLIKREPDNNYNPQISTIATSGRQALGTGLGESMPFRNRANASYASSRPTSGAYEN